MTPDEKELLKRSVALAEQNYSMLRGMQRSMRIQRFMSMLYWLFIIGSAVGAYYLIQPYIDAVLGSLGGPDNSMSGLLDNIKNLAI